MRHPPKRGMVVGTAWVGTAKLDPGQSPEQAPAGRGHGWEGVWPVPMSWERSWREGMAWSWCGYGPPADLILTLFLKYPGRAARIRIRAGIGVRAPTTASWGVPHKLPHLTLYRETLRPVGPAGRTGLDSFSLTCRRQGWKGTEGTRALPMYLRPAQLLGALWSPPSSDAQPRRVSVFITCCLSST